MPLITASKPGMRAIMSIKSCHCLVFKEVLKPKPHGLKVHELGICPSSRQPHPPSSLPLLTNSADSTPPTNKSSEKPLCWLLSDDHKQFEGRKGLLAETPRSQLISEGSEGRNHQGTLLTALLPGLCSTRFLTQPRPSCSGTLLLLTMGWDLLY